MKRSHNNVCFSPLFSLKATPNTKAAQEHRGGSADCIAHKKPINLCLRAFLISNKGI